MTAIPAKRLYAGLALASTVCVLGWLLLHSRSPAHLTDKASQIPIVAVATIDREDLSQTLTLSGEFRPDLQVALHAKIAGYLQSISVDVGDEVHEGQIIAQLDVPEM